MSSLDQQVGGNHYKGLTYQPVAFSTDTKMNFIQGSIVKYVSRFKNKNGLEDLDKAKHFAKLGISLNPQNFVNRSRVKELAEDYCLKNGFSKEVENIVYSVLVQDWIGTVLNIGRLIAKEYERNSPS